MVDAVRKYGTGWAAQGEVPLEEVGIGGGGSVVVGRWACGEFGCFTEDSLYGGGFGVEFGW